MTEEQMNIYKMRISQAGIVEFTLIMLEMEMQWMAEALEAHQLQDTDMFLGCVERAQAVQVELMNVLNLDNEIATDVYAVFAFVNRHLIQAKRKQEPLDIKRCKDMLEKYYVGFKEIAATDKGGPVMEQSEKVYAGLTYGAGGLIENSMGGMNYKV